MIYACIALLFCLSPEASNPAPTPTPWVVSAKVALEARAKGALVLDARARRAFTSRHIKGALHSPWTAFSVKKGSNKGELKSASSVKVLLEGLGVSNTRPVLVVGDPLNDWGEEGRIVWMLRSLGHPNAMMVDGGIDAMLKAGAPAQKGRTKPGAKGVFTIKNNASLQADASSVRASMSSAKSVLIDVRERREYEGKTPYGEARGGHVPGAVHLYFKDFLDASGHLLPRTKLKAKLKALGIEPDTQVIAYCTGGIRSAWMVVVLHHLGYPSAKNYAGSMWQWSAMSSELAPLRKGLKP